MERIAPAGDVYQAGTLSGNPLATAAGPGHAARCSDADAYARLDRLTAALADGLARGGGGRRPGPGLSHHGAAHRLLQRGARA